MLTAKQHELICFIHDRLAETGVSPSFEEMKDALDLKSKSGVHRLISALEERAFIRRLPNRARALEVLRMPERPTPHRKGVARIVSKRSEEHTSELQSLMRISYAVFCLKKKKHTQYNN